MVALAGVDEKGSSLNLKGAWLVVGRKRNFKAQE